MAKIIEQDLKWPYLYGKAEEFRKQGKTVPPFPDLLTEKVQQEFEAQARPLASEILEQERRNYVEYLAPYMRTTLENARKRLRFLVMRGDQKIKRVHKRVPLVGSIYIDDPRLKQKNLMQDVYVTEDGGTDILDLIFKTATFYSQFAEYVPWMSPEIRVLWDECESLAYLETVEEKDLKKEQTATE